jgi:DNA-binding XRE family transcriptional regulator
MLTLWVASNAFWQWRQKQYHHTSKERHMKQLTNRVKLGKRGLPNLRILRQRKGLSLGQLADLTGLRRDTITHLEAGRVDPEPYHLRILARVLEVRTFELVS